MRLSNIHNRGFSDIYEIIRPYSTQAKEQWDLEMAQLRSGRKKVQLTELIAGVEGDTDIPTSKFLDDQTTAEIVDRIESTGLKCYVPDNFSFHFAIDQKYLDIWEEYNLSTKDWSDGHPFLAGWLLGYSTGHVAEYYRHHVHNRNEETIAKAMNNDYKIYLSELGQVPPGGMRLSFTNQDKYVD